MWHVKEHSWIPLQELEDVAGERKSGWPYLTCCLLPMEGWMDIVYHNAYCKFNKSSGSLLYLSISQKVSLWYLYLSGSKRQTARFKLSACFQLLIFSPLILPSPACLYSRSFFSTVYSQNEAGPALLTHQRCITCLQCIDISLPFQNDSEVIDDSASPWTE